MINMIQRKQSIYLFLAAILMLITFFAPMASFIGEYNSLVLYLYKVESLVPGIESQLSPYFILPLLTIVSLVIIFAFVTIFFYKRRRIQLILVRFMILLVLIYFGLYFFHYQEILENITGVYATFEYGINIPNSGIQIPVIVFVIPLVSAILLFMASRGILNDEKLIQSADRLR